MRLLKRFPIKLTVISAAIILAGAGVTTYMAQQPQPTQKPTAKSVQIKVEQPQDQAEDAVPVTVVEGPAAPVDTKTTIDPSAQSNAATAPDTQPTYKFADEMAANGIAESDYGYVTDMVLDTYGWRMAQRYPDKPLWHLARQTRGDLTEQLRQVNFYVSKFYEGSWSRAHETYVQTRNF